MELMEQRSAQAESFQRHKESNGRKDKDQEEYGPGGNDEKRKEWQCFAKEKKAKVKSIRGKDPQEIQTREKKEADRTEQWYESRK